MGTEEMTVNIDVYDCFDNPNWTDEALKQCTYKNCDWLYCDNCCNHDICKQWEEPITIDFNTVYNHIMSSIPAYDEMWEELLLSPRNEFVGQWNF